MDKNENLKYQLETLASYLPEDLDNPEFEVAYETESGCEGFNAVCCIDVAARSLERIKALEYQLDDMQICLRHKAGLLASREKALEERDAKYCAKAI